ncbi:MAG: hypothetical protein P4M08_08430 [Oligoflexia bacterium]|nr:hypothetical protein [Oligoflexia bacterium]
MIVRNWVILASLLSLQAAPHAFALAGAEGSGGGSRIESAFRLSGSNLIQAVASNVETNRLCPSDVMQRGLDRAKITVVNTLVDGNTGKPIEDQHLDAWTRPGSIQLRYGAWVQYIHDDSTFDPAATDALILHEIYRSTGQCDDDTGALSTTVYQLLTQPQKPVPAPVDHQFDRLFVFKYSVNDWHPYYTTPAGHGETITTDVEAAACESPFSFKSPKAGIRCAIIAHVEEEVEYAVLLLVTTTADASMPFSVMSKTVLGWSRGTLDNQLGFVAPNSPLYMIFNFESGAISCGPDLNHMTGVN